MHPVVLGLSVSGLAVLLAGCAELPEPDAPLADPGPPAAAVSEALRAAEQPYVWVGQTATIDESGLRPGEARRVMGELAERIAEGEPFQEAYAALFRRNATLASLGDFVVSPARPGARTFHDYQVPEEHVLQLARASAGDLVMMKAAIPHHGYRYVLYEVREVYRP